MLPLQCHYVVEEHESDIIDLYGDGHSQKEIENELCYDITGNQTSLELLSVGVPTGYCAEYEHTEL